MIPSVRLARQSGAVVLAAMLAPGLGACPRQALCAPAAAAVPAASALFTAVPRKSPPAARAEQDALMAAIFAGAYLAGEGTARATVPAAEQTMGTATFAMSFLDRAVLPDGRIAVVVNGSPMTAEGGDLGSHAAQGLLNVYLLRQDGVRLEMLARHENVLAAGSHGQAGRVGWLMLGPGRPGLVLFGGGVWQGYRIAMAEVVGLGDDVRALGGFRAHSDNTGACGPELADCWDIGGVLRVAPAARTPYGDLVVEFTGRHYTVTGSTDGKLVEHAGSAVRQTARYRFDGHQYVLAEGGNPVPEI